VAAVGIGLTAVCCAGVQRAVGDDLQRSHDQSRVPERIAGTQSSGQRPVEVDGVGRRPHPQPGAAGGVPLAPPLEARLELVVDDPDDSPCRCVLQRPAVGLVSRGGVLGCKDAGEEGEPLRLTEGLVPSAEAEPGKRGGRQPAGVGVAADEDDRT
jgi:hypothetical protein